MRLTALAAEAKPQVRTYKRTERPSVTAVLPDISEPVIGWVKAVCEKLGSSHVAIVGVNENSQPVFVPVFELQRVKISGENETTSIVYGTRKPVSVDPREGSGNREFHLLNDVPVALSAVSAINDIPRNGSDVATVFENLIIVDAEGSVDRIPLSLDGQTFRPTNPLVVAEDNTPWNFEASVFPYKAGNVRIGVTIEPAKKIVAAREIQEDEVPVLGAE